jgi:two-component system sensor kinase FixL
MKKKAPISKDAHTTRSRSKTEIKLPKEEGKFRAFFEQSLDGLVLIDDKCLIIDYNESCEKLLGFKRKLVIGKPLFDVLYALTPEEKKNPDTYEYLKNSYLSYIDTGIYPWEKKWVEREVVHPDGSGKIIDSLIFPIITDGRVIFGNIFDDITERKKAEMELESMNRRLEEKIKERTVQLEKSLEELNDEIELRKGAEMELLLAKEKITEAYRKEKELNELKTRFISMISHEYRSPLTVIMTTSFLLEKYYNLQETEKFAEKIEMIQSSVQSMTQMLENVLMVGKGEKGTIRADRKKYNLEILCRQIVDEIQVIDKYKHNILMALDGKFENVNSDENLVHSIITNLLLNAVNYSSENEDVRLELIEQDNEIVIRIIDQGVGISPQDREYVFDSFYRGSNVGSTPGFGLGLSLVKLCVGELGGSIDVESELYHGTTFKVILPK